MISDYIEQVADHNSEWIEWAVEQIAELASVYDEFTSDMLRIRMANEGKTNVHPNAIGAAFKIATKYKIITRAGFAQSQWPTNNRRIVSLWSKAKE